MLFVRLNGVVAETLGNELVDKLGEGEVEVMGMKRGVNAKTFFSGRQVSSGGG